MSPAGAAPPPGRSPAGPVVPAAPAAPAGADEVRIGFTTTAEPARIRALEALGVDSLWVGGHVSSRNPTGEAMVALARLSAVAERVQVGTAVLLLPLYPPAIVAKQIADLDVATGGRVVLGVGVGGEYPQEFRACGVPLAERGPRTDEAIPLLRRLWSGEELSHDGPHFPMDAVRIHPAPARPGGPPIVVAGRRAPAMRRAARLGDGWFPYLYSPERYAASVAEVRAEAATIGRDLDADGFGWHAFVFVHVDPDGDAARASVARMLGGTYDQDVTPMVDRVAAAGTAAEVTARLCAFLDAGARHLVLTPAVDPSGGDAAAVVERLVHEVLPAVRAHRPTGPGPAIATA